ncbi:hypothetical protein P152DRAFT_419144 [Eremomyces bilateralis CBS 781.70]|uniref:RING-type E3 ubiquitin transferase n=1 Tax=Eremomyces bilateralis CBS 781.70 TaxID=1392243 RepID=A0A6G1FZ68_9PEZI|nr:uncharacterized protein P152DRAFT_419144 [Eremomyces bilateralis CBS 781.70]KAF1811165.1 hypothetical protein P152DRAFT_419144 [Eremomyces bilateralis CBS 781.70]
MSPNLDVTTSTSTADACVICLDNVSERAESVPCGHCSFDFICLVSWLQEQALCPLCKAPTRAVRYDHSPTDPSTYKTFVVRPPNARPPNIQGQSASSSRHRNFRIITRPSRRPNRAVRPWGSRATPPPPDTALLRRREVYRHGLYSLHVGSNRLSRYRTITPAIFSHDADLQRRARAWIRRELRVWSWLDPDASGDSTHSGPQSSAAPPTRRAANAEFLLEYIISILRTVDIKGASGTAEELLSEFLGTDDSRLFLHELSSWLRSPFTKVEDWDRAARYPEVGWGVQQEITDD